MFTKNTYTSISIAVAIVGFALLVSASIVYAGGGPGGGDSGSDPDHGMGGYGCGNGGFGGGESFGGCTRYVCYGGKGGGCETVSCSSPRSPSPPPPPPPPPPTITENFSGTFSGAQQPCYDAECTVEQKYLEYLEQLETSSGSGGSGSGGFDGSTQATVNPLLSLTATPLLVHSGDSTTILWSSQDTNSCSVSGPNGFAASGVAGSQVAENITEQSTYTLTCQTQLGERTDTVIVNIIPVFQEI